MTMALVEIHWQFEVFGWNFSKWLAAAGGRPLPYSSSPGMILHLANSLSQSLESPNVTNGVARPFSRSKLE